MYKIGNDFYKLCLLDTNTLSYILRDKERFERMFALYPIPEYLYVYSPYVLYEISKDSVIFENYITKFGVYPSLLLKNERELFAEEIKILTNPDYLVRPWLLNMSTAFGFNKQNISLDSVFSSINLDDKFTKIQKTLEESFKTLLEWTEWSRKYSIKNSIMEYRTIEAFCVYQIDEFNKKFFIYNDAKKIKFKDFPSIRTLGYSWFYKFVSDSKRKPDENDVVDLFNIMACHYCDVFMGENNMVDILQKLKKKNIIRDVELVKASILL